MIADVDGQLVEIPDVTGIKTMADGSIRFKLFGGPYHDNVVRVHPPFERIVFEHPTQGPQTYKLSPPVKVKGKWVYIYDPDNKTSYTDEERNDPGDLNGKWAKAYEFLAREKERVARERDARARRGEIVASLEEDDAVGEDL